MAGPCAQDHRPGARRRSRPIARRPRRGRISATPIGAWPISRPTVSTTRRSRACAPRKQAPGTAAEDRIHLCFALGKALEDRGEIAQSWAYYERGNALKRAQSRYRPEIDRDQHGPADRGLHAQNFSAPRTGWGDARPDPIFILGLPRSGSTLLEQILASHSQVEGTQELADIQRIAHGPDGPRHPTRTIRAIRRCWPR